MPSIRRVQIGSLRAVVGVHGWAYAAVLAVGATGFLGSLPFIQGTVDAFGNFASEAEVVVAAQPTARGEQLVPRRASGTLDAVPGLVGLELVAAENRASKEGFILTVEEQFSETVPQGQVVAQTPAAGMLQRRDEPIAIVVSAGRERATVPNVIGLTASVARREMEIVGFQVVELAAFSEDVAAGVVLRQEPLAGALVDRRSVIALSVSRGVETTMVPPLVGRSEADARRAIELAWLVVGEVKYRESGLVPNGIVEMQEPSSGTAVPKGYAVAITVVRVGEVEVPSLAGQSTQEAERILADLGLLIAAISRIPTEGVETEAITGHEPGTGAKVPRGFGLRLLVAIPPPVTSKPVAGPAEG